MDSETDSVFPKFAIARPRSPAREPRALPNPTVHLCSRIVMKKVAVACTVAFLFGCGAKNQAADDTTSADAIKTPATVEQAARVLDLSTFPLMDGAKSAESRHVANLSYVATGDVKKAFEFHRKALFAQGWKELPNSSVTDQSASAMFSRDGFVVSLSVIPYEATGVSVRLQNLGNVKPGKLPIPPNAKPVYVKATPPRCIPPMPPSPATADAFAISSSRKAGCRMGRRGFRHVQTERKPRDRDCLVRARAGREDHDPVFESTNFG